MTLDELEIGKSGIIKTVGGNGPLWELQFLRQEGKEK